MKKRLLAMILISSAVLTAGVATGVTLAATYTNPVESYTFDGSTNDFQSFSVAHYFHGGTGASAGAAYEISSPIELRNLSKLQEAGLIADGTYFKLVNSFSWSGASLTPIGSSSKPWKGNFDGDGKTIHGLVVNASGCTYSGMFGYMNGGSVQNFILSAPQLTTTGASTVGFAVGRVNSGTCTKIAVYGGTANLKCRAKLVLGGATTSANAIVGAGTSTCINFTNSVPNTNLSAATAHTYASATTAGTYYLWLNGGTVTNSN